MFDEQYSWNLENKAMVLIDTACQGARDAHVLEQFQHHRTKRP
jgi:flagellar biosynthesis GTPase FlhF